MGWVVWIDYTNQLENKNNLPDLTSIYPCNEKLKKLNGHTEYWTLFIRTQMPLDAGVVRWEITEPPSDHIFLKMYTWKWRLQIEAAEENWGTKNPDWIAWWRKYESQESKEH